MKCYTLSPGGKLQKAMNAQPLKSILGDSTLRAKERIAIAFPYFKPLPIFELNELKGRQNMYSYGNTTIVSKENEFTKAMKFTKTTVMVLYEHSKFYPDPSAGDESSDVWMGRCQCLLVGMEGRIALREIETGIIYGIRGGKITKDL